jgi:galactokinase
LPPPSARSAFAPGRVNLLGEHTDYNGGLCLPLAIEQGVTVTAGGDPTESPFVQGVAAELGVASPRVQIASHLPVGGGLSSSAALCVAAALALGADPSDPVAIARLCSRVERERAGANTGLLDQLASLLGRAGHALRLDMRLLEAEPVPLELGGWRLVVLDSGASRRNADSGYNERRRECDEACRLLGVASLSEAEDPGALPEPLRSRARHVREENARVDQGVAALRAGDLAALGELLSASHASLRDLYEVSVPEVERTVEDALAAGAAGARVHGGGFGGGVLALFGPGTEPPEGALAVAPGPGAHLLKR